MTLYIKYTKPSGLVWYPIFKKIIRVTVLKLRISLMQIWFSLFNWLLNICFLRVNSPFPFWPIMLTFLRRSYNFSSHRFHKWVDAKRIAFVLICITCTNAAPLTFIYPIYCSLSSSCYKPCNALHNLIKLSRHAFKMMWIGTENGWNWSIPSAALVN